MTTPKIAIIGAGPAGLTLARLLLKNGLSCTVYEADSDRHARNQGGSLDLHAEAGQLALKEAGLFEEFKRLARPEGDALRVLKFDGTVAWDDNLTVNQKSGNSRDRPEIDRVQLRDLLLDSIESSHIKWNSKIARVVPDEEVQGKTNLHFADGTSEAGFDLVVGADGAWSKVRPLLSSVKPFYSGVTGLELWANDVSKSNPWLSKFVGNGSMFMFDDGRAVLAQRQGSDSIRIYAAVRQPEDWLDTCGIDFTDHEAARKSLVDGYFSDCGEDIKRAILESKDELVPRKMWMLPVGLTWAPRPGITCIGDAAHLMTPFAGVGVNVAMRDALELARELIAKKDVLLAKIWNDQHDITSALERFEKEMFERSHVYASKTEAGLKGHFSVDGVEHFVGRLSARG